MAELLDSARLRLAKYSKAYKARLVESGSVLVEHLHGLSVPAGSKHQIDNLLEQFVSAMYQRRKRSKRALRIAKHAILFVQVLRPRLRSQLRASWSTIKSWEEQEPSRLRAPMPLPILMGLTCLARLRAETCSSSEEKEKLLTFSVLVGLGFFGLLRPGELLALRREDISLQNQLTFGSPCVTVCIRKPKNFRQLGHSQFAVIKQPDVCNWIAWLCVKKPDPTRKLWVSSPQEFRKLFKFLGKKLLRSTHPFVPASLRAGGATCLFDQFDDVNRLRLLGRWASMQSLEHYVQTAKSQQLLISVGKAGLKRLQQLLGHGHFLLSLPKHLSISLPHAYLLEHGQSCFSSNRPLWQQCRQWGFLAEEV